MSITVGDLQQIATRSDLLDLLREFQASNRELLKELRQEIERSGGKEEKVEQVFYSATGFARLIGVSKGTVSRWCEDGVLNNIQPAGPGTIRLIPGTEINRLRKMAEGIEL